MKRNRGDQYNDIHCGTLRHDNALMYEKLFYSYVKNMHTHF